MCIEAGPKNTQYFFKSADVTRFQSYVLALEHGCTATDSLTLSARPNFGLKLKELLDLGVNPAELLDFKRAAILKVQADRSDGSATALCADYAVIRLLSQGSISHDDATTAALQGVNPNEYVIRRETEMSAAEATKAAKARRQEAINKPIPRKESR